MQRQTGWLNNGLKDSLSYTLAFCLKKKQQKYSIQDANLQVRQKKKMWYHKIIFTLKQLNK